MTLVDFLLLYGIGFALIVGAVHWSLRKEPTAHGQIVGRQMGCLVALLWPIALPWFALVGIAVLVSKAWARLHGGGR